MPENNPKVSIIIPTYNRETLIEDAINSILSQTSFYDFELLIVDDGSIDDTRELISRSYSHDGRIRYIYKNNSGVSDSRNFGINYSNGDLIAFLDSDDIWEHDKLANQVYRFDEDSSIGMVGGYSEYLDEEGNKTGIVDKCPAELYYEDFCIFTAMPGAMSNIVIRKSVLEDVGGFRTDLSRGEGKELFMRISEKYKVVCPQRITTNIRLHDTPRHNFDFDELVRNKLLITSSISDPKIKRKAIAYTYFRLFRVGLQHIGLLKSLKYLFKSFTTWPCRIHHRINRIKQIKNIIQS